MGNKTIQDHSSVSRPSSSTAASLTNSANRLSSSTEYSPSGFESSTTNGLRDSPIWSERSVYVRGDVGTLKGDVGTLKATSAR